MGGGDWRLAAAVGLFWVDRVITGLCLMAARSAPFRFAMRVIPALRGRIGKAAAGSVFQVAFTSPHISYAGALYENLS